MNENVPISGHFLCASWTPGKVVICCSQERPRSGPADSASDSPPPSRCAAAPSWIPRCAARAPAATAPARCGPARSKP
nr:MAG TPA: hypothetical protein [Caudoviricetes sp.]